MKRYILLTLIFTYSLAHSETFNYTAMTTVNGFEGIFTLSNLKDKSRKITLDCQSFFNKLDFYDKQNILLTENYISVGECEYLYKNFDTCLAQEKIKCVDTEDIFNENCKCK